MYIMSLIDRFSPTCSYTSFECIGKPFRVPTAKETLVYDILEIKK